MTKKICLVGAPSCRKSTVAAGLESELKKLGYNVDTAEEYARTYIQRYGVPFNPFQQFLIFRKQEQREQDILGTKPDYLITDTAPWLGVVYIQNLINKCPLKEGLHILKYHDILNVPSQCAIEKSYEHAFNELSKLCMKNIKTYDYIFFLPIEGEENINDGVRTQSNSERENIHDSILGILNFLRFSNVKYWTVSGKVDDKIKQILDVILGDKND